MKKFVKGVRFAPKNYSDEVEAKIQHYKREGYKLPSRHLLRTEEQLAGIRESARINTALARLHLGEYPRGNVHGRDRPHGILLYDRPRRHPRSFPVRRLSEERMRQHQRCGVPRHPQHKGIPAQRRYCKRRRVHHLQRVFLRRVAHVYDREVSPEMQRLVQVTRECRDIGIQAAQPWARLGDVGAAIQEHAEKNGYSVVRDLCGHGVGIKFHEEPDVEHFGKRGTGMLIVPGMTFTIEPMINMGSYEVFIDEADGWTVCTDDGLPSAQWESMILITEDGNEILTQ